MPRRSKHHLSIPQILIKEITTMGLLKYVVLLLVNKVLSETICPATRDKNVRYFDVRLSELKVPNSKTHYICQQFMAPAEETYHAIAFEPLIGKGNVVHHMLLFGCENDMGLKNPHGCTGDDGYCRSWLAQYTVGVQGQICTHEGTGVRFGKDSFQHLLLQIHWNNEHLLSNLTDNSGMRVYYTTDLRDHDIGNVQIGQNDIEIPAKSMNTEILGSCSERCTREFHQPLYITRAHIHMHYLGTYGKLEIYRNGKLVEVIAQDVEYKFELSPIHVPDTPVKVLPGDEIRLTCGFSSGLGHHLRNKTIYYGKGSDGEMCYAFITYYPRIDGFDQCIQFSDYDINCKGDGGSIPIQCPFDENQFAIVEKIELENMLSVCKRNEQSTKCSEVCVDAVKHFLSPQNLKCRRIEILGTYMQYVMKETTDILNTNGFYENIMRTSKCYQ